MAYEESCSKLLSFLTELTFFININRLKTKKKSKTLNVDYITKSHK